MINPHSEFSLSHSLVKPDELGFKIFLRLNFLQKIMMINLPGPHLCPLYPIAKALAGQAWFSPLLVSKQKAGHTCQDRFLVLQMLIFFLRKLHWIFHFNILFHVISLITDRGKGWLSSLLAWKHEYWDKGSDANLCSRDWLIIQSRAISIKLLRVVHPWAPVLPAYCYGRKVC